MRRRTLVLSLALLGCQAAPNPADDNAGSGAVESANPRADPGPSPELTPSSKSNASDPKPSPKIVRTDLVALDLPPIPTLALIETSAMSELAAGTFAYPEGVDELTPRAALAVRDGLLLVGQGYQGRRPGLPSPSWRWSGFTPTRGEPSSTLDDSGAIRAAIAFEGGGLLTGEAGIGVDARGWFGTVSPDGTIGTESSPDSPGLTELFDLVAGGREGELAVVAGYVDARGWLVSLDDRGDRRWETYIGSDVYLQVRGLARLDAGDLLLIGVRANRFGQAWTAIVTGEGAAEDDIVQTPIEIAGADPNQLLRTIVDLGPAGYVAFGTAKRNYYQAHDQLLAVSFDRTGKVLGSRVVADLRVTDIIGAHSDAGVATLLVSVPTNDDPQPNSALALVRVGVELEATAVIRQLAETEGWSSAGFVEGSQTEDFVAYRNADAGLEWRRLSLAPTGL